MFALTLYFQVFCILHLLRKKNFFTRSLLFLRRSIAKYFYKPMAIVFTFFKEMEIAADLLLQR